MKLLLKLMVILMILTIPESVFSQYTLDTLSVQHVTTCYGDNSGEVVLTVTGGTSPYEYKIEGGTYGPSNTFTGLSAGNPVFYVRDAFLQVTSCIVVINEPDEIFIASEIPTHVTGCHDDTNGEILITASGGTGTLYYSINNGTDYYNNGGSFTNLGTGTYNIKVRDDNNCVQDGSSITINAPLELIITGEGVTDVFPCNGLNNGIINITTTGGTSPFQYSIDNGTSFQGSNSFSGLSPGNYPVVVEDANGCQTSGSTLTVNEPDAVSIDTETANDINTCYGYNDGSIILTASGGTGTLYYSIDGGTNMQDNGNFLNLYSGTYDVIVRDENSCEAVGSTLTISDPPQLVIDSEIKTDVNTCFGDATGSITINASGGSPPIQYSIDNGLSYQAGNVFSVTGGSYSTKIKDFNDCEIVGQSHLVSQPTELKVNSYSSIDVNTCYGGNNGSVTILTNGGGTPSVVNSYEYMIDDGGGPVWQYGNTFTGLTEGTYTIGVRDSMLCTDIFAETVYIDQPTQIVITQENETDPTCFDGTNGYIEVIASGGTGSLYYSPDGTNYYNGNILTNLSAGIPYEIHVQDDNGCDVTGGIHTLGEPSELVIDSETPTDVSDCFGGNDGSIEIVASGGTPPIYYSIDGGFSYQTSSGIFNGLSAGSYQVMVKDGNNCITVGSLLTVSQPDPLFINYEDHTDIIGCNGDNIGEIVIQPLGGTPQAGTGFYQYSVNGGAYSHGDGIFSNLSAGTYIILVQDENGCEAYPDQVIIDEPEELILSLDSVKHVNCNGNSSGYIQLSATGGQVFYDFSIDGGTVYQINNTFSNLSAGTYQVRVIDAYNCVASLPDVIINEPTELTVANVSVTEIEDCYGDDDGIINIQVPVNGTPPYSYSINNGNNFYGSNIFTDLIPGNYFVKVRDDNGCEAFYDFDNNGVIDLLQITEPPLLEITDIDTTHVNCYGQTDGEIFITAAGGTPHVTNGYKYSIDAGSSYVYNSGNFTGLASDLYNIIVQDENNCVSQSYPVPVYEPQELVIDTVYVNDEKCPGDVYGSIVFRVYGGTYPYQYSETGGAPYQSNDTIILLPGTYTPAVIDYNNCTQVYSPVTINAAPLPGSFTADVTDICSRDTVTFTRVGPGTIYRWDFGDNTSSASTANPIQHIFVNTDPTPVIYTVVAYATSGAPNYCYDTTRMDITVNPEPVIDFTVNPDTVYFPDPTITITNNSTPGYTGYIWDFGDGSPTSSLEHPGTHTYTDCGEFIVTSYAELGACNGISENTVFVTAYDPIAEFELDTTEYCLSALEDYGYMFNFTNLSQNYDSIEWIYYQNTTDTIRGIDNISLNPGDVGEFTVYLDAYGYCDLFDSKDTTIVVHRSPIVDFEFIPDTILLPNQPLHCYNLSSSDSRDFFWEFGDGGTSEEENPVWYYTEEGSYQIQLTVTSENECVDSLTLLTEVIVLPPGEIIFPNAFSPNGDGINDTFSAAVYESVEWFKLEIYNRWGEKMFVTDDIMQGWDGYFDGKLALQDVYVWRAEGVFLNGTPFEFSGSVTLIR